MNAEQRQLIRWLASDEAEHKRALESWVRWTPRARASAYLAEVLDTYPVPPERFRPVWVSLISVFLIAFFLLTVIFMMRSSGDGIHPLFPLLGFLCFRRWTRRPHCAIGRRAALLLAPLNDARAIVPLANAWQPHPTTRQSRAENERIEEELTRLVTLITGPQVETYPFILRALTALLHRVAREARRPARSRPEEAIDLSDRRADMLLAILRFVGRSPDPKACAAVKAIADLPMPAPNYQLIGEAASEVATQRFRAVLREQDEASAPLMQGIRS